MYAELTVAHSSLATGRLSAKLEGKFGPSSVQALAKSPLFSANQRIWERQVAYATETMTYRLICLAALDTELQAVLEPMTGNLVTGCQSAWDGLRSALGGSKPELKEALLVDTTTNRELFLGSDRFSTHVSDHDLLLSIAVTVVTAAWILVASLTYASGKVWEVVGGGGAGLLGGVVGVVWAGVRARRRQLVWRSR